MRVAVFSTRQYDRVHLDRANIEAGHALVYFEAPPRRRRPASWRAASRSSRRSSTIGSTPPSSASSRRAAPASSRCAAPASTRSISPVAAELGIRVVRVPAYSPYSVAEHTIALILALNRHIPRAVARVRDGNFALDGLVGFDMHGKTAGVVGTGTIGKVVVRLLAGFGCRVLACDPFPSAAVTALGATYTPIETLLAESDIVTLHCPLTPDTHHLMNDDAFRLLRKGAMLINTSRGGLIDTRAAIKVLKSGHLGTLGIDVYEEEAALFFEDLSGTVIQDYVFTRLLTFPNVIVTAHQAFLTTEALNAIADTTLASISAFAAGEPLVNEVRL